MSDPDDSGGPPDLRRSSQSFVERGRRPAHGRQISSADHVITVASPSRRASQPTSKQTSRAGAHRPRTRRRRTLSGSARGARALSASCRSPASPYCCCRRARRLDAHAGSTASLHAAAVAAAAAAAGCPSDLETGGTSSSGGASPSWRGAPNGASQLPRLAPPSAAVSAAVSAAAAAAASAGSGPGGGGAPGDLLEPLLPPSSLSGSGGAPTADDPFPATTAARAAAAQVARFKALQASAGNLRAALVAQQAGEAPGGAAAAAAALQRQLAVAFGLSWVVNVLLLVAKLYAYYLSASKAVLASAADSAVDLVSQVWRWTGRGAPPGRGGGSRRDVSDLRDASCLSLCVSLPPPPPPGRHIVRRVAHAPRGPALPRGPGAPGGDRRARMCGCWAAAAARRATRARCGVTP